MNGLMEQIKPENKKPYINATNYLLYAKQTLARNIRHLLIQNGKLLLSDFAELDKLIQSEDLESIDLAIMIMEAKTGEKYIL